MKEGRDCSLIYHMNKHFADLKEDLIGIDSFSAFLENEQRRRAILFDFLQIGELANQLSKSFKQSFNNDSLFKLISMRNRIAHGYDTLEDDTLYESITDHLPTLISEINSFGHKRYRRMLSTLLGKTIHITVQYRPKTTVDGVTYPINYGQYLDITALDGFFQDVYIIGSDIPLSGTMGKVIAIIQREDDIEDQLVVAIDDAPISDEEIEQAVNFKEKDHKHRIIR